MDNLERRFLSTEDLGRDAVSVEERADGRPMFRGYAARYQSLSVDLGGFREVLLPGAFDKVLNRQRSKADVVFLFNHSADHLLGRTSSGTLRLASDEKGLRFENDPPDTQLSRDLQTLVRRGDLAGCSFAFTVDPASGEAWSQDERGQTIRTIREVSGLYDCSLVTTPAYPSTTVAVRSLERWRAENLTAAEVRQADEEKADTAADAARDALRKAWDHANLRARAIALGIRIDELTR